MSTVADFFAGLGGFSQGAIEAGARPVFAANHWQAAIDWHAANHPETEHVCQELGEMDKRIIPDVDLFVASPACQGFSTNGQPGRVVRNAAPKHQADRNTSWAVISAADTKRPDRIIVENVPMMAEWELFPAWLGCLQGMGYKTRVFTLNAKSFGTAQDRKRLVVTASLSSPIELESPNLPTASLGSCLESLPASLPIAAKTLGMQTRMRRAQQQAGSRCFWANVDSARGRPLEGPFPTITTKTIGQAYILDGDYCRMLTARELARGQGFPDSYQLPTTRTLAGRLIGNAIPVQLARSITEQVLAA